MYSYIVYTHINVIIYVYYTVYSHCFPTLNLGKEVGSEYDWITEDEWTNKASTTKSVLKSLLNQSTLNLYNTGRCVHYNYVYLCHMRLFLQQLQAINKLWQSEFSIGLMKPSPVNRASKWA